MKSLSSSSLASDGSDPSDMKNVIKVFLMRVANKTTSRFGITLFLFCSSLWLLTHAFLALHNGCWMVNQEVLTRVKAQKASTDCKQAASVAGIGTQRDVRERVQRVVLDEPMRNLAMSHEPKPNGTGNTAGVEGVAGGAVAAAPEVKAVFSVIVERGGVAAAGQPDNMMSKDAQVPGVQAEGQRDKRSDGDAGKRASEQKAVDTAYSLASLNASTQLAAAAEAVPTKKPFPPGTGVPVLKAKAGPYKLPVNTSRYIEKLTKETWQTMGCVERVSIFAPGARYLPQEHIWRELLASFQRYNMGYFLLRCPNNACDLILRTASTAKSIANALPEGGALLVGATTQSMRGKTRAVMEELNSMELENPIKTYLFSLDSSPMMNYYEPYMANFQYHYSMTYHSQSSVPIPYGHYRAGVNKESERNWAEGKTGLVAWVEDNCNRTFWPRIEYVHELSKHIQVDTYGRCGNLRCKSLHCREELKKYKFVLALEEAACDEFITLAFWQRGLAAGAVPVVYGGRKFAYEKVGPPKSFLHIADYASPEALAQHLLALDKSDSEYNQFQRWRTRGSVDVSGPGFKISSLCSMVPQLIHQFPPMPKVMSMDKFYRTCRKGIYVKGLAGVGDLNNWTPWV